MLHVLVSRPLGKLPDWEPIREPMKITQPPSEPQMPRTSAAAYVRMSTEHQKYSTSNQMDIIEEYAARRGMDIIQIYSDEGKSGLRVKGRDALTRMIGDVTSGKAKFSSILVYDISRWGRFQDADESAHYEFMCRRQGISVHYCAEMFENDGSMMANMNKMMKRMMAGDYSRELSVKVFQGACRLIRMGYKQGGAAGYGLRRMLVDQAGNPKGILRMGEHKSIQTDRVVLVPGPDEEVADVRWIYSAFIEEGLSESEIAAILNTRGVLTDYNRAWNRATVHQILTNEKYIGNNVYHRTSFKLKSKHQNNAPDQWVRADGSWQPIVDPEQFLSAQKIIADRARIFTDEELLEKLRSLLAENGRISGILIDETDDMPSSAAFRHRFGSLVNAYSLIAYTPSTDYSFLAQNRSIRRLRPEMVEMIISRLTETGASVRKRKDDDLLLVNDELLVSIVLCRHVTTARGSSRWLIRLDWGLGPDLTIAARLEVGNAGIRDFYLLPMIDMTAEKLGGRIADENGVEMDAFRFDDLSKFFRMAERTLIHETI